MGNGPCSHPERSEGSRAGCERTEGVEWAAGVCDTALVYSLYSETVLDHFKNPRNAGDLAEATAVVEVSNPVCGDILRLGARVEAGRIVEARFKTQGCVTAIACSSQLTEILRGKTLDEARRITPAHLSELLGGLPPATAHGAQLACDALESLLKQIK